MADRLVRNEEATGSIPVSSTRFPTTCGPALFAVVRFVSSFFVRMQKLAFFAGLSAADFGPFSIRK
jgi:hypothetical protein